MRQVLCVAVMLATLAGGCTHKQLTRSTVLTTSTVMDIQFRIVLMNLARMSCEPGSLPSHIDLAEGVVQVNDRAGVGNSGGLTTFNGIRLGIEAFGPDGQRQVTEQWGADATNDPQRLTELQDLYRVALGLPPLPPPNAITFLRQQQRERGKDGKGGGGGNSGGASSPASSGGGGSVPSGGGGGSNGGSRRVPIDILLTDVPPPGWFHLGAKKDVPKGACYVGCHGDRYAWVMPDGVPALARFTVTVLAVVKLDPGEPKRSGGLAVTR